MKLQLHIILLLIFLPCCLFGAAINITNLKVEYTEAPLGLDVKLPRFSWQMIDPVKKYGMKQRAYHIIVTDESGNVVWDSGRTVADVSLNIQYKGSPLKPSTRYDWLLHVWDQENKMHDAKSWFETGLMDSSASLRAWSGAKWIGAGDEMVLYAAYLPVFKITCSIALDAATKSTRGGFIYGANDMRLMSKNKNLYNLESKKGNSYILIEVDIAPLSLKGNAILNIYRAGYHPQDKEDNPYKSFPIPSTVINEQNKYAAHSVQITSDLGHTQIYVNGMGKANLIADLQLNPLGSGGDFIAFPVVGEIGFSVAKGQRVTFSNLEIRHYRSPSNIIFREELNAASNKSIFAGITNSLSFSENGYRVDGGESGMLIMADPSRNSMPMLRTTFAASQTKIAKARLYVTARGIYDVYLNGKRISDDYFNPGLTQYNKTHFYQTFDVTNRILPGTNAFGAVLGEGWWSGAATFMGQCWNYFGDRQSLLAKLVITYDNGQNEVIVSDPDKWFFFDKGPLVYGSFYQGEVYDATREAKLEGWSTILYDASSWKPAKEIALDGHTSQEVMNGEHDISLRGHTATTVRKIRELTASSVEEVRPGVFVYDMGQNMVGVPNVHLSEFAPGKKIVLRFAEVKYPDRPEHKGNVGMIMLENIRAAMAQDIYITKGGEETIHPRFTFHGYRFLEITGIDKALPVEAVKGTVLSSIDHLASHYETSSPEVNRLWENITWSTLGNFLSIPTDCPQRNERLGWSGDISVFARTATYLGNLPQFLRKHMLAMRDAQRKDGRFPDVSPMSVGFGGLLWGSAGITVAWESYQQYGDLQMVEEHYNAMKEYINYVVKKNIDPETNILMQENPNAWSNLGDWLGPEQERNDNSQLWEAYFIFDLEIMKKFAALLGKTDDEKQFNALQLQRRKFFNEVYFDKQTKKTVHSGFRQNKNVAPAPGQSMDTQTSYVLPLVFDIVLPEYKDKVVGNFVESVSTERKGDNGAVCPAYSLMTGFIGTAWINKALSDNGRSDVAYRLLQQTSYPSWLYPVRQGATTIWERLNSYTSTNGFGGNNNMNSFNHYSFGAVGAWMYNYSLGIERDESSPGFKHFILQPEPDPTGGMSFANGYYESMYGRIESGWEKKADGCNYHFVVPANTSATLYLSAPALSAISTRTKPLDAIQGVKRVGTRGGKFIFEIPSGEYNITISGR